MQPSKGSALFRAQPSSVSPHHSRRLRCTEKSRDGVQSPKADMQNACCRQFTNPHKLTCKPACNPNTNAANIRQFWATGSQQLPGGAGLRRHPKKTCSKRKPNSSLCRVNVHLRRDNDVRHVSANPLRVGRVF
jgi:hypothetical protein